MKNILILLLFLVIVFQGLASSQNLTSPEPSLVVVELWNNFAFYDTNLEKDKFAALLGRYEGKVGFNVFNLPLQLYGVYYGVTSQAEDYWNNSLYHGAGVRFRPFDAARTPWFLDWIKGTKIYAEKLTSSYQKNLASAEAAGLKEEDSRYGIEIWREWNLDDPDERRPWGELWANLSCRSTNFTAAESDLVIFYLQPKFGRHLGGGIEAYLRFDLTSSNLDSYWLNTAAYGVGVRFAPWRKIGQSTDFFRKVNMFAEILGVSYLKEKPADPQKEVSMDVRFGVDFSYGR